MTHSSEFLKRGRAMRFRPNYKKQISLPVDIGRPNNHQQVAVLSAQIKDSMRRTQLERTPNEDEMKKERVFVKEEDARKDSPSNEECTQLGLQLRTIADTWNRTYLENVEFHRQRIPQLGVIVFIVIFQMCA